MTFIGERGPTIELPSSTHLCPFLCMEWALSTAFERNLKKTGEETREGMKDPAPESKESIETSSGLIVW